MEKQNIPQADLLDILFDGRNKEYGAYQLRKTYNNRLIKSLVLTGSACLLLAGSYVIAGKLDHHVVSDRPMATEVVLEQAPVHEKAPDPPPPPPVKKVAAPMQIATIRDVVTKIVPDNKVRPEDVPPPNADLDNMKIGNVNNLNGNPDNGVVAPPVSGNGNGVAVEPTAKDDGIDNTIFYKVEIESDFIGGPAAWKRFLLKNFHPEQAVEAGVSGTIVVEFIVDREGNVSNVQAISGPEELRQEAVRVIRKSGKWNPAIQNGQKVNSYKRQPITVTLSEN